MRLKDIESVDAYVRQHIIDEQHIDRSKAKAQIDNFLELQRLVADVQKRLAELDGLKRQYHGLSREFRRCASLKALAALYETELASDAVSQLEEQLESLRALREEAQEQLARAKALYEAKDRELLAALNNQDPDVRLLDACEQLLRSSEQEELRFRRWLLELTDQLVKAFRLMQGCNALNEQHERIVPAQQALEQVHRDLLAGSFDAAGQRLTRALKTLDQLGPSLDAAFETAREAQHRARRLTDWLKVEAARDLDASSRRHAANLGVEVTSISMRSQSTRWGSCSTTGKLNFNWRLILAPPFVLDYVAAHEVAHLLEMNHSPDFWNVVARTLPTMEEGREWLRVNGRQLMVYGIES